MVANQHKGSRFIFVGNVPYDMSEEQLINVFREVGKVVAFRLIFDRETGKPKGYGFCEFEDPETAASAVRNLNDTDVGGRHLRIDFAEGDPLFEGKTTTHGQLEDQQGSLGYRGDTGGRGRGGRIGGQGPPRGGGPQGYGGPLAGGPVGLPPNLPTGVPLAPGVTSTDAISQTLATLPPDQLLDIMSQMKGLVNNSPEQAKQLLTSYPALAYALFQAMLMMNIVDPSVLQRMLSASGAAAPPPSSFAPAPPPSHPAAQGPPGWGQHNPQLPPPPQAYQNTPPQGRPAYGPNSGQPNYPARGGGVMGGGGGMFSPRLNQGLHPSAHSPIPGHMGGQPGHPTHTPPQAPIVPQPQPTAGPPGGGSDDTAAQQQQLLMQVLSLTQDQINALPPDQRQAVMALRAQVGR